MNGHSPDPREARRLATTLEKLSRAAGEVRILAEEPDEPPRIRLPEVGGF